MSEQNPTLAEALRAVLDLEKSLQASRENNARLHHQIDKLSEKVRDHEARESRRQAKRQARYDVLRDLVERGIITEEQRDQLKRDYKFEQEAEEA